MKEERTLTLRNSDLIDTNETKLRAKSKWQPINDRFHALAGRLLRLHAYVKEGTYGMFKWKYRVRDPLISSSTFYYLYNAIQQ